MTEPQLKSHLASEKLARIYFLYGDEPFFIAHYKSRIEKLCHIEDEFNITRFEDSPPVHRLKEAIETLPVFDPYRLVVVRTLKPEAYADKEAELLLQLLGDIPDTTVLLIYSTDTKPDKKYAANKKFLAEAEKHGVVCEFAALQPDAAAAFVMKKYPQFDMNSARYLAEKTDGGLYALRNEADKLIHTGEPITPALIDRAIISKPEARAFDLSDALIARDKRKAFGLLADLLSEGNDTATIIGALASSFTAEYFVALGKAEGVPNTQIAKDFGFTDKRVAFIEKRAVRHGVPALRKCALLIAKAEEEAKLRHDVGGAVLDRLVFSLTDERIWNG